MRESSAIVPKRRQEGRTENESCIEGLGRKGIEDLAIRDFSLYGCPYNIGSQKEQHSAGAVMVPRVEEKGKFQSPAKGNVGKTAKAAPQGAVCCHVPQVVN